MSIDLLKDKATPFKKEDLPTQELQWIADEIGVEATVRLVVRMSGLQIYIPRRIKDQLRQEYARRYYNGHNAKELAMTLDVGERTIYFWLAATSTANGFKQEDLFGDE